ncbi:MAG TPA: hypothetical protein PKA19_13240 [Bacillota bacterium]|nr:hypothetical protein [Bacillota bacterium]
MMNNDELFAAITDAFDRKVEEVKLHTGALVEDLRGDVKAIAEGHDILFNKMDNLERRFDGLERRLKERLMASIKGSAGLKRI